MIVDGYNVIHAWNINTSSLEDARHTLIRILDDYAGYSGEEITVVFDAYNKKSQGSEEKCGLIKVVYTDYNVTADTYIQRYVRQSDKRIKVVTADYLEQMSVFEAGAARITPSELKLYIERARKKHLYHLHRSSLSGSDLKAKLKLDSIPD
jgi:predicted RNA-binding protein with PIN domain